jgi:hypothetical protein
MGVAAMTLHGLQSTDKRVSDSGETYHIHCALNRCFGVQFYLQMVVQPCPCCCCPNSYLQRFLQIPSDSYWPSLAAWSSLNETLAGRLIPTTLPTSVCPNGGQASETYNVNATEAKKVQTALLFAREHNLKVNVNNTGHAGANTIR